MKFSGLKMGCPSAGNVFLCFSCLTIFWSITNIVIVGMYAEKELAISIEETTRPLGIIIISQNVITITAFITWIVLGCVLLNSNSSTDDDCFDIWPMFDMSLLIIAYFFSWIAFGWMCSYHKCFYVTTPLYVITIIYWMLINCSLLTFIIYTISEACWANRTCRKRWVTCNENCHWWCCGVRPKWMLSEPVVVTGQVIKLEVKVEEIKTDKVDAKTDKTDAKDEKN